ncbi:MAG TPA: DsbA family protein [Gaiellaceae bacterium]|nr:DsbA family protein [Gaiellaceae bacterium]
MKAAKPGANASPSGRTVVFAFAIAVAAAVALVAVALLLRGGDDSRDPSGTPAVDLEGIPQDRLVLGSTSANVTLIEYADLQCPFCRDYSERVFPAIVDEYIRPGTIGTEFRGLAFLGPDSEKALRLVLAAGLQDRLWQLQEALFAFQGDENSGWVTDDLVRRLAGDIPGLDVDRMFSDAESTEVTQMIQEASRQAQADQVPGTPTFFIRIGGDDPYQIQVRLDPAAFRAALDDALQG